MVITVVCFHDATRADHDVIMISFCQVLILVDYVIHAGALNDLFSHTSPVCLYFHRFVLLLIFKRGLDVQRQAAELSSDASCPVTSAVQ